MRTRAVASPWDCGPLARSRGRGPAIRRQWLMPATALCGVLLLLALVATAHAAQAEDGVLAAAQSALAAGQPVQALNLLTGHPGVARPGLVRLVVSRAQLALGRGDEALAALDAAVAGAPPGAEAWPPALRGAVAQVRGEALLARAVQHPGDESAARQALENALRQPGDGVAVDRCLDLLAELARRAGDGALVERYAGALWGEWPRSAYHAHAGVLLARQVAVAQPERARAILADLRVSADLPAALRLDAVELLCRVLLPRRPGECLVVAEQETARAGAEPGQLPLYRALALAALDPDDGRAALAALTPALAADPAVAAARARLDGGARTLTAAQRRERAAAEAELGHGEAARGLLAPLIAEDADALALFVQLPGTALEPLATLRSARQLPGALALGRALVLAGHAAPAWVLLQPHLGAATPPAVRPTLLYWAEQAARAAAPDQAAALRTQLLACPGTGEEIGLAWSDEARRRESAGGDAATAWARAAAALPIVHPWQAPAAWRAARAWSEQDDRLAEVRDLLQGPAWAGDDADQLRCRFLLAQVLERLGDRAGARRAAASLRERADPAQRERLERMIARLQ